MNILIIGGSGVIGYKLVKALESNHSVDYTYFSQKINSNYAHFLDIEDNQSVKNLINNLKPDVIIHLAYLSGVDYNELHKEKAYSVNVTGTKNIIEGCKNSDSKIVFVSTTYVFDGKKSTYTEDDTICPTSYYGHTKNLAEKAVTNSGLKNLILRTDQPYCWVERWQKKNSVMRLIDNLSLKKQHKEVKDWFNVPTYVPDFVHATEKLLENQETGIFHVTGPDFINRYEWSSTIADVFGLQKDLIIPINSQTLNLPVKRNNVNVSNKKLEKTINLKMRGIKDGALDMLKTK